MCFCSFSRQICNKYLVLHKKKGHSPEFSFKKVTLFRSNLIVGFFPNNLSSFIILRDYMKNCCQFVVKFALRKALDRINTGFIYPNFSSSGDLPKKRLFYSLYAIQRPYGIPYFSDYYMLFLCDPIIITKVAHWQQLLPKSCTQIIRTLSLEYIFRQ